MADQSFFDTKELKKLLKIAASEELPFAFGLGPSPDKSFLVLHRKKKGKQLFDEIKKAKKEIKKGTYGMASTSEKTLNLKPEKDLPGVVQHLTKYLKATPEIIQIKVKLLDESGQEVPDEEKSRTPDVNPAKDEIHYTFNTKTGKGKIDPLKILRDHPQRTPFEKNIKKLETSLKEIEQREKTIDDGDYKTSSKLLDILKIVLKQRDQLKAEMDDVIPALGKFNHADADMYFSKEYRKKHLKLPAQAKEYAFFMYNKRSKANKEEATSGHWKTIEAGFEDLRKRLPDMEKLVPKFKSPKDDDLKPDEKKLTRCLDVLDQVDKQLAEIESNPQKTERKDVPEDAKKKRQEHREKIAERLKTIQKIFKDIRDAIKSYYESKKEALSHINTVVALSENDKISLAEWIHYGTVDGKMKDGQMITSDAEYDYWEMGGKHDNARKQPELGRGKLKARLKTENGRLCIYHLEPMVTS